VLCVLCCFNSEFTKKVNKITYKNANIFVVDCKSIVFFKRGVFLELKLVAVVVILHSSIQTLRKRSGVPQCSHLGLLLFIFSSHFAFFCTLMISKYFLLLLATMTLQMRRLFPSGALTAVCSSTW
jgi:uncharacterized BrkB/YihY/UPF0761 family membrane protein